MALASRNVDDGSSWVAPSQRRTVKTSSSSGFGESYAPPLPRVMATPPAPAYLDSSSFDGIFVPSLAYQSQPGLGVDMTLGYTQGQDYDTPGLALGNLVANDGRSFLETLGFTGPAQLQGGSGADAYTYTNPAATRWLVDQGITARLATLREQGIAETDLAYAGGLAPSAAIGSTLQGYDRTGARIGSPVSIVADDDPGSLFGLAIAAAATFGVASVLTAAPAAATLAVDAAPAGLTLDGAAAAALAGQSAPGAGLAAATSVGGAGTAAAFGGAGLASAAIDAIPAALGSAGAGGGAAAGAGAGLALPTLGQVGSALAGVAGAIGSVGQLVGAATGAPIATANEQAAAQQRGLLLLAAAGAALYLVLRK